MFFLLRPGVAIFGAESTSSEWAVAGSGWAVGSGEGRRGEAAASTMIVSTTPAWDTGAATALRLGEGVSCEEGGVSGGGKGEEELIFFAELTRLRFVFSPPTPPRVGFASICSSRSILLAILLVGSLLWAGCAGVDGVDVWRAVGFILLGVEVTTDQLPRFRGVVAECQINQKRLTILA